MGAFGFFDMVKKGKSERSETMSKPGGQMLQQYTREQMEELAKNRDNIVMMETESKNPTSQHKFRNEFLKEQVLKMRSMFEDLHEFAPKYSEVEIQTKILNCRDAKENSWMVLAGNKKFIFDVVLKKFTTTEEKKKYDALLKCLELEVLRERGLIKTDKEIEAYWKKVGLSKEMNPVQHALEQLQK
jgi:hypothetical protein